MFLSVAAGVKPEFNIRNRFEKFLSAFEKRLGDFPKGYGFLIMWSIRLLNYRGFLGRLWLFDNVKYSAIELPRILS